MDESLPTEFLSYASGILADTHSGLSGQEIVTATTEYAVEWNVALPYPAYPFGMRSKRTVLLTNLRAFPEAQQYRIIRTLCDHPTVLSGNRQAAERLKMKLIVRYGHLANEAPDNAVDGALVQRTEHWLGPFPNALRLYDQAACNQANGVFLRNVLDDLRLALELLLKELLNNQKSLENQNTYLGDFIERHGGSPQLRNMFVKLIDYYTKYQNSYVKHDDAIIEEEVEFIFELTSSFMKHVVRLSYKEEIPATPAP
jgi:hypothetical protein